MAPCSYVPIVRQFGLTPAVDYPWAVVGRTSRTAGWKLHLSSIQAEAPALLDAVLPILDAARVPFKVAEHEHVLALLNEGEFGPTQVGKFITIYPASDHAARTLAERLVGRTRAFAGPEVVSDLHLGSVVYARYGSFSPIVTRDRLGRRVALIDGPGGALVADHYDVPFVAPAHVTSPFAGWRDAPSRRAHAGSSSRLMIGHYLVVKPLGARASGGAWLALDLGAQSSVGLKVLKYGRPFCMSDSEGRDIRDRLKHQVAVHARLSPSAPVPPADPYFEIDDVGYAPVDYVEGRSLEAFMMGPDAHQVWGDVRATRRRAWIDVARDTVRAVAAVHRAGYVHRDLSPSNVRVRPDGRVALLDLELAHALGDPAIPFGLGTAGFMSPQQERREAPAVADDVFAIGSLLTLMLVRLDPRRVVFRREGQDDPRLRLRLSRMADGAPPALIDVVCACLAHDPGKRPDLDAIEAVLSACLDGTSRSHARQDSSRTSRRSRDSREDAVALPRALAWRPSVRKNEGAARLRSRDRRDAARRRRNSCARSRQAQRRVALRAGSITRRACRRRAQH